MLMLPDDARQVVMGAFFRVSGPQSMEFSSYVAMAEKVCDRADALDKAGKFDGKSVGEIADVIYGGWWMWMFYWRNRELIWKIANLLAELAFAGVSRNRVVHTARS